MTQFNPYVKIEGLVQPIYRFSDTEKEEAKTPPLTCNSYNITAANEEKKAQLAHHAALVRDRLISHIIEMALSENPFFIASSKVQELKKQTDLSEDQLLLQLADRVMFHADPQRLHYYQGAIAIGAKGDFYLGVNLELLGFSEEDIYAEQFLLANARNHGEIQLKKVVLTQVSQGLDLFRELGADQVANLEILTPYNPPKKLTDYLLPATLRQPKVHEGGLLAPSWPVRYAHSKSLDEKSIDAARISYTPYSKVISGVAIKTCEGKIYCGSCLESANPKLTIAPLQSALVALIADGKKIREIEEVWLTEEMNEELSYRSRTQALLKSIAPQAKFSRMGVSVMYSVDK